MSLCEVFIDDKPQRNPYVSGYGAKIPTRYRIRGNDGRIRRVYAACYSNVSSLYILKNGERVGCENLLERLIDAKGGQG